MTEKNEFLPDFFALQWHITERCNWRCKHCYQENYATSEMNLEQMEKVVLQYIELVKRLKLPKRSARIQITGGEPLLREDFFLFLDAINKYTNYFHWGVMSNGSLLTKEIAQELKARGISFFQVSLEGTEKTNDAVRGSGSFRRVLAAIDILSRAKIYTTVSLTLSRENSREIRELARLLDSFGVSRLATRRIVPLGREKENYEKLLLEPDELKAFYEEIENINKELQRKKSLLQVSGGCENAVFNNEISSVGLMSHGTCGVNDGRILTLLPDGEVLICRRFPIKLGNVLEKTLKEIYYSSLYENFRGKNSDVPLECYPCPNLKSCLGGAKCVSYALTGKIAPDPQCWKLFGSLEESVPYVKRQNIFKKLKLFFKVYNKYK